jgi:ABC-type polar amino acid transport system ATPase subunit
MRDLAALGMTMVVATHEMSFARRCASRVIFMDAGRVVESGRPDEVLVRPREVRTQQFLASIVVENLAPVPLSGVAAETTE